MLVLRLRRRPNINPTPNQCLMFTGSSWGNQAPSARRARAVPLVHELRRHRRQRSGTSQQAQDAEPMLF